MFLFLLLFSLSAAGCSEPLSFDKNGFPHGTGETTYSYSSGAIKLREEYIRGNLTRSRWFKPDGTLIQETQWKNGAGEGIYLREDGSIRRRMQYVKGVAEGPATSYDEHGNITNTQQYHLGQPVDAAVKPATQPSP